MRLVILQPFYLPYAGVFELVRLADTFVVYDDVQFSRQHWDHRNRIKTVNGPAWLTVPVHASNDSLITDVTIAEDGKWRKKHLLSIRQAYARAPYIDPLLERLQPLYDREWSHIVDLNLETFHVLRDMLGVDASFLRSSELPLPGAATDRILRYCQELGATSYLSGRAARDYLDEVAFDRAGVELEYFVFDHPTYPQLHGDFVPYLSAIDLIANAGDRVGEVLHGSGRPEPVVELSR